MDLAASVLFVMDIYESKYGIMIVKKKKPCIVNRDFKEVNYNKYLKEILPELLKPH